MRLLQQLCVVASFTPSYLWLQQRTQHSESAFATFTLIPLVIFLVFQYKGKHPSNDRVTLVGIAIYAACWMFDVPGIIKASLATTLLLYHFGVIKQCGISALAFLTLPWMSSLEFFLSYPLRRIVTELSAIALKLIGFAVESQGTGLSYLGHQVFVDPPCSGIKMLWSGTLLCALLSTIYRLSWGKSSVLFGFSTIALILANSLRGSVLFFPESQLVSWPGWTHSGVGSLIYLVTALLLIFFSQKLHNNHAKTHSISHSSPTQ